MIDDESEALRARREAWQRSQELIKRVLSPIEIDAASIWLPSALDRALRDLTVPLVPLVPEDN